MPFSGLFMFFSVQRVGKLRVLITACNAQVFQTLYGKHAAALYAQAADFNKTARFYYMKAQDAYYLANAQASYDDWRRARRQWVSTCALLSTCYAVCVCSSYTRAVAFCVWCQVIELLSLMGRCVLQDYFYRRK